MEGGGDRNLITNHAEEDPYASNGGVFKTEVSISEDHLRSSPAFQSGKASVGSGSVQHARAEDAEVIFDYESDIPQPLPPNVNLEAIIMNVLREAPFAVGRKKLAWRRHLGSPEFQRLAADAFWHLVAHTIQGRPPDPRSPQFARMADNYVRLFFLVPPQHQDDFFAGFHEALACTLLLCLLAAYPRAARAYRGRAFKAAVMDRCSEWVLGLRRSVPAERNWIHSLDEDPRGPRNGNGSALAAELNQTLGASRALKSGAGGADGGGGGGGGGGAAAAAAAAAGAAGAGARRRAVGVRSTRRLQHSPLVAAHLAKFSGPNHTHLALQVALTEDPARPLCRPLAGGAPAAAAAAEGGGGGGGGGDGGGGGGVCRGGWKAQYSKWRTELLVDPNREIAEARRLRAETLTAHAKAKKKAARDLSELRLLEAEKRNHVRDKERAVLHRGGDVHGFSNSIVENQKNKLHHKIR